jgi:ABC-type iron transport system FetAB ATPase subunit
MHYLFTLRGPSGSGKSITYRNIINLLSFNGNHPLYLVKGIRDADAILSAFGHAAVSEAHFDASKFGKYVEFQYCHGIFNFKAHI